jgi:hypothetical protein
MTLQQTVTIPADRRLYLDLPETAPTGHAEVLITITLSPSPAHGEPKLGMLTTEQLKTLMSADVPDMPRSIEVLERREALQSLAWQYGKSRKEHSLFKYAGCLKDSGVFDGDAMIVATAIDFDATLSPAMGALPNSW